jgi:hypothetical protein
LAIDHCEWIPTYWKAMLGEDERDATAGEITAVETEHGPFLSADGEG